MMGCTDRHFRRLVRAITQKAYLYTEMTTANAVIFGDRKQLLDFDAVEHPVALQLGGSEPKMLAQSSKIAKEWGYDEINLNVGCPSSRVQSGKFGVCLMKEPGLVAECVAEMNAVVNIPITVKTRIGVDHQDRYESLCQFVERVKAAGCRTFIVHARKAWLKGLNPKQNRTIPPLNYECVYQLKKDFPDLEIIINGGIKTLEKTHQYLQKVDGVMLGREAYSNPYLLATVDQDFYGNNSPVKSHQDVILEYLPYIIEHHDQGIPLYRLMRPLLGLFQGMPNAKSWRYYISNVKDKPNFQSTLIEKAKRFEN